MNNFQYLLSAYRDLRKLTPLKPSDLDFYRSSALDSLEELILKLVSSNDFIVFCGKLSEDEKKSKR